MARNVLVVENLCKEFGKFRILNGINLKIQEGEIFGLLGPNGAGKTTFTKIVTGVEKPSFGMIQFFGKELFTNLGHIKKHIAVIPQEESFYRDFTVKQNLWFFGMVYGLSIIDLFDRTNFLLEWMNLSKFQNLPAKYLSGGYRRLLNAACSLVHDPKIIFLDEPTVALDPSARKMFWQKIRELKKQGKSIILTTHYMGEAQKLSDRVAIINKGQILVQDTPKKLIEKYAKGTVVIFETADEPKLEALKKLEKNDQVDEVKTKEKEVFIFLSKKASLKSITRLADNASDYGMDVLAIHIKEPSLEDVFLNLTGEKLVKNEKSD